MLYLTWLRVIVSGSCLALSILLASCKGFSSAAADNAEHPLHWVESAMVEEDIKRAISRNDYRLLAFSERNISLPGVEEQAFEAGKKNCQIRFLPGTGDVVRSAEDRRLRRKALQYATQYNQTMLTACQRAKGWQL